MIPPATVAEALHLRCEEDPDRRFVLFEGGSSLSRSETALRAAGFAAACADAGLTRGDRVLLALNNGPAFLDAWFGCAIGGYVMVPLNTRLRGQLLEDIVRRSEAAAVVAESPYDEVLETLIGAARLRVSVGVKRPGWMDHQDIVETRIGTLSSNARSSDAMSIIFTSGTTGPAKGVVLSQSHYVWRSASYVQGLRIDENDTMFTCLPLFHNNAQMASVLVALLGGGETAVYGRFSVSGFWNHVRESGATRFTLIGRMANQLLAAPPTDQDQDHSVRSACIVPHPRGEDEFESRFGFPVISQYYGCTEMLPIPPDLEQERRPGSCGRPGESFECMVVDADDEPLPDGEVGELVARPVRPSGVMDGYLDMPAETLHAFRGLWFHTGDTVRRDAEGFYYLVGRLKDVIRYKGENISATEVEAVVVGYPGVADAALVGEPDEWGEETPVLFAEAEHDVTIDPDDLLSYCVSRLPDFMVPTRVNVVVELPRNALGRVEKFKLRKPSANGEAPV